MSCSNWPQPLQKIAINYHWCVWAEHWRKNGHYTSRDMTKWFCNMTMLGHVLQNGWKPTWKYLNGKSYLNHHIHLTLPYSIITCSDQWYMAWLSSTFILWKKKWVNSWLASKDVLFFQREIQMLPESWNKVVASDGQYFQWHVSH